LAAARLVKYWSKRLDLFGEDRAFKPLTLSSIYANEDEVALKRGFLNLLPDTDESGRGLLFADPSKLDPTKYEREMMVRVLWYILHAALENESTQQKGIIIMAHPRHAKFSNLDRTLMKMNVDSLRGCLPVRLSVFYIVHPPSFFKLIFPFIKLIVGSRLKQRIKLCSGTDENVLNNFKEFGISEESLPTDIGGKYQLDLIQWIEKRRSNRL